jgi:FkbM family methyltransferase
MTDAQPHNRLRKALAYAVAPTLRFAPHWWRWRIYSRMLGDPYRADGFSGVTRRARVQPHGYEMQLALDNWMERYAYFSQHYYEPATILTLQRHLRPGDVFVDVGANVGMIALTASALVGASGQVLAFEPNVDVAARLEASIDANGVQNIRVFRTALGDVDGDGRLDATAQHGTASLRAGVGAAVPIRRGDAFLEALDPARRVFVKIDVEGYEHRVLIGFGSLLARRNTAFLVEVTDAWLRQLGSSAQALFDDMRAQGYAAIHPTVARSSELVFERLSAPRPDHQYDVLFMRPHDDWPNA